MRLNFSKFIPRSVALQAGSIWRSLSEIYRKFSPREKFIVGICGAIVVLFLANELYAPVAEAFENQTLEVEQAKNALDLVAPEIQRYKKLKTKRDEIENKYRQVEFQEGVLSHLEKLINEKLGLTSGAFTITDKSQDFGAEYTQRIFTIKFKVTNMAKFVDFLKEIVKGPKPLLLSRVDATKSYTGDRLDVEIDASSLSRRSNQSDEE